MSQDHGSVGSSPEGEPAFPPQGQGVATPLGVDEYPVVILGGLPAVAEVVFGKDADTPNGPGEYWAEVRGLWWRRRDGSKGTPISDKIRDRAEKHDHGFCGLTEFVSDECAREAWLATPEGIAFTADQAREGASALRPQTDQIHNDPEG